MAGDPEVMSPRKVISAFPAPSPRGRLQPQALFGAFQKEKEEILQGAE